jgi:DNA-binding beta-propeller fold protein YncE
VAETEKRQIVFTRAQTGTSPVALLQLNKKELAVVNEWEYSYNGKGSVTVFDMVQYRITESVIVPGGPSAGAVSRSRRHIFLSVPLKDEVVSVNVKTGRTEHTIKFEAGALPGNMAFSKDGRKLFVASRKADKITVIQVNGLI